MVLILLPTIIILAGILLTICHQFFPDDSPFEAPHNLVTIVNLKHDEPLTTGDPTGESEASIPVNYVFTDRSASSGDHQWTLEATGVSNQYRIRNKSSRLLLVASEDFHDPERRKVVSWTGNTPVARTLDEQEWDLIKEEDGYVIKSARYGEYLYAAADDLAFDDNNRSVFTWKEYDNLGPEGRWKIETV